LHVKPSWPPRAAYLLGTTGSFTADDSNTLGPSTDECVSLSKSEYDSLIQKIHLVSTSDVTTFEHHDISYLASLLPSS